MLGGPHIVLVDYFSPKLRCSSSQKWIIFTIAIGTLYPKLCTMWCPRRYKLMSKLHYIIDYTMSPTVVRVILTQLRQL
jgi:hypothetical protein